MAKRRGWASVLLLVALAAPAFGEEGKKPPRRAEKLAVAVYLAAEFDAAVTYHRLQNCGSSCYEANPMVRPFASNPSIFVVLGASAYGVNYVAGKLKKRGHPRWAKVLRVVSVGAHAGAGVQALAVQH